MLRRAKQTKRQLIEEANKRILGEQIDGAVKGAIQAVNYSATDAIKRLKDAGKKWAAGEIEAKDEVKEEVKNLNKIVKKWGKIFNEHCLGKGGKEHTGKKWKEDIYNTDTFISTNCEKVKKNLHTLQEEIFKLNTGIESTTSDGVEVVQPSKDNLTTINKILITTEKIITILLLFI